MEYVSLFDGIASIAFIVWLTILFYLSLKKCFWKKEKSKVRLVIFSLLTSPFLTYVETAFLSTTIVYEISHEFLDRINNHDVSTAKDVIILCAGEAVIFVLVNVLYACLIGKWLNTSTKSAVIYLYMMFNTLAIVGQRFPGIGAHFTDLRIRTVLTVLSTIILFLALWIFYHMDVAAFARMAHVRVKVDWKLFNIPPAVFTILYSTLVNVDGFQSNVIIGNDVMLVIDIFSVIILYLFLWAFLVIIKNINATNEAVEAKDLAAEMARAEALVEADLNIAKNIQISALPSVFPPFPEHREFELFASMNAAKEVGGDFYDFYMIDDHTLGFLIADVSGKSIPGALFMMTSKTVIKSLAESGSAPAEVFTRANEKLCEGNETGMFVTAWMGYLDLHTGLVRVVDAGHNPPLLIHGGKAEYVMLEPELMLAGLEGICYEEQTLQLEEGDMLFLYTDGVTEAMDTEDKMYGEDRLKDLLSFGGNEPSPARENGVAGAVCEAVLADVKKYSEGAVQSDDITMLCVRYLGTWKK